MPPTSTAPAKPPAPTTAAADAATQLVLELIRAKLLPSPLAGTPSGAAQEIADAVIVAHKRLTAYLAPIGATPVGKPPVV